MKQLIWRQNPAQNRIDSKTRRGIPALWERTLTKCLTKICSHLKMQQKPRGKKHRMCFEQIDISDEMVCVGG